MRALIIEPDDSVAGSIELMLACAGIRTCRTDEAADGIDLARRYDFDVLLIEPAALDMSGPELVRRLRAARVATPVMILTGVGDIDAKVQLLHAGADDHLAKPFHRDELVARLVALVRRSRGLPSSTITVGELELSIERRRARVDGHPVHLTGKQFALLELLALRRGTVVSKDTILGHLYGGRDEPDIKIVDVFICKLRKKLGGAGAAISTVWGRGYVLDTPTAIAAAA